MKSLAALTNMGFSPKQKEDLGRAFSEVSFYDDTTDEESAIQRAREAHVVIFDYLVLNLGKKFLESCRSLELIIIDATTTGNIPFDLLREHNVKLSNLADFATRDVAEIGVNMVMSLNNKIEMAQRIVEGVPYEQDGYVHIQPVYDISPGHPVTPFVIRHQLKKQTVGIVGLGSIGLEAAGMFAGLGMRVIAYNRSKRSVRGIEMVPLRRLFQESDVIFISLKYDSGVAMNGLVAADLLELAKEDSILVSIAHPNLLDMDYLIKNHAKFRGIGIDFAVTADVRRLLDSRKHNIIVTPFLGSQSVEAYDNMTEALVETAIRFAGGKPIRVVNEVKTAQP